MNDLKLKVFCCICYLVLLGCFLINPDNTIVVFALGWASALLWNYPP